MVDECGGVAQLRVRGRAELEVVREAAVVLGRVGVAFAQDELRA